MSEAPKKKEEAKPEGEAGAAPAKKKKPPIVLIGVIAGIMIVEAVVIYMLVGKTGPAPATAAAELHGEQEAAAKRTVEVELIDEKFQNMQTGKTWMWDVQIVLKVRQQHETFVSEQLEKRTSEIKEGLSQIFRRAQHSHLCEPELTTLNRQIHAFLDRALGLDPDGNSRVERVLIPRCRGIQIEH